MVLARPPHSAAASPPALVTTPLYPSDHDYTRVLALGLQALGWQVQLVAAEQIGEQEDQVERLAAALRSSGTEVVFSININPTLARLATPLGFRYIWWGEVFPLEIDYPQLPAGADVWAFDASREIVAQLRQRNVRAHYHPLGFDPQTFSPRVGQQPDLPLAFVGNGLLYNERNLQDAVAQLRRRERSAADPTAQAIYGAVRALLASCLELDYAEYQRRGYNFRGLVERRCADLEQPPEIVQLVREAMLQHDGRVAAAMARRQRLATLAAAAQEAPGLRIYGRDWGGTSAAPYDRGPILYSQSAEIYRRAAINLHVHRFYHRGVSDRVFNVPACGGLLLSNNAEAFGEILEPGCEVVSYGNLDELREKLRYLQQHEAEARAIAAAGCRKVHAQYCVQQRLWELLGICGLPRPAVMPAR